MPDSTLAGVITAAATVTGGLITGGATVIVALILRKTARVERKVDNVQETADANHKIMNQERTDRLNYQAALIRALKAKGIEVPIDQSLPDEQISPEDR